MSISKISHKAAFASSHPNVLVDSNPSPVNGLAGVTGQIVAAYVARNAVSAEQVLQLIGQVRAALIGDDKAAETKSLDSLPVSQSEIRKSITPDHLISFEDGRPYKMLKRHLWTHDLSPQQYREKWGLPADYPMVAPNYSIVRSQLAKSVGLGVKPGSTAAKPGRDKP